MGESGALRRRNAVELYHARPTMLASDHALERAKNEDSLNQVVVEAVLRRRR